MTSQKLVLTSAGLRFRGQTYPCSLGKTGLTQSKAEGDGATPVGTHRIVGMLYRPDRMAMPAGWARPIGPGDLWCDDPARGEYNTEVKAPFAASHEILRRADPLYDLVLITDWNWPKAEPGRGSAIFVHQWRRRGYPTEGCIALRRDHLRQIAAQVRPGALLVVPALAGKRIAR